MCQKKKKHKYRLIPYALFLKIDLISVIYEHDNCYVLIKIFFFSPDDLPRKKLAQIYKPPSPEMLAYLDFSVSTTGILAGVKVSEQRYVCPETKQLFFVNENLIPEQIILYLQIQRAIWEKTEGWDKYVSPI